MSSAGLRGGPAGMQTPACLRSESQSEFMILAYRHSRFKTWAGSLEKKSIAICGLCEPVLLWSTRSESTGSILKVSFE